MTRFCLCEAEGRGSLCSTVSARSVATRQSIDTRLCEAVGRGSPLFLRRGWQINLAVRV